MEYGVGSGLFRRLEWGKVRYLVMLELMPPQALNLVEIAVVESTGWVIRVPISLKMARDIKSTDLIALF